MSCISFKAFYDFHQTIWSLLTMVVGTCHYVVWMAAGKFEKWSWWCSNGIPLFCFICILRPLKIHLLYHESTVIPHENFLHQATVCLGLTLSYSQLYSKKCSRLKLIRMSGVSDIEVILPTISSQQITHCCQCFSFFQKYEFFRHFLLWLKSVIEKLRI